MTTRIVVADGSAAAREVVTRILSTVLDDALVVPCRTGAEVLARLAAERFDFITTSLLLPDMDGLDLCRRIRTSDSHYHTPIVIISGDADQRLNHEGSGAGVTAYFDKSQGFHAFGDFIRAFFRRYRGLAGRILYVEDSPTAAALTQPILARQGLQITHVLSCEQALEELEGAWAQGEGFDLIVTDFHLKGEMTGADLLHVLRTRHRYSQQELPVLVLTGRDDAQTQLEVFHAGANDFVTKPLVEEVFIARVHSLLLIKRQFDTLKQQARTMQQMATTDSLTGVRNRRYLVDHGTQFVTDEDRRPAWLMLIDVDHFKRVNDEKGHITGDHVLVALGGLLNRSFPDGMVTRFGGEEFAVLLAGPDGEQAMGRAEALRHEVERLEPDGVPVTISIGLTCADDHPGADLNRLLGLADKALYAAKDAGRNSVWVTWGDGGVAPVISGDPAASDAAG